MSSVQTSAWPTCVASENYHLWTLALNFCHILPDDESGRNGKCRWQLPLANWQHSAKYIISQVLSRVLKLLYILKLLSNRHIMFAKLIAKFIYRPLEPLASL